MKPFDRLLVILIISFVLPVIVLIVFPFSLALTSAHADGDNTPAFSAWVECVQRGPYPGQAVAYVGYAYAGEFQVTPEDSRLMGDTATGETTILNYPIEPGQHDQALIVNVGANKAVLWKIILFSELHVVAIWDNSEVKDCDWATPEPTLEATPNA